VHGYGFNAELRRGGGAEGGITREAASRAVGSAMAVALKAGFTTEAQEDTENGSG